MPKAISKYLRLRELLKEHDIDQEYLAELLKCSGAHVSHCLSGKSQWRINEVWTIVQLCHIDPAEICVYFPQDGVDIGMSAKQDPAERFATELAGLLQSYIKEAAKA